MVKKSRYNKDFHPKFAYKAGLLLGDKEKIADFLGIAKSTLYLWEKTHKEFAEALRKSLLDASLDVAESLFTLAKGGYQQETIIKYPYFLKDGGQIMLEKKVIDTLPPNYKAIEFWLRNKQNWKSADFKEQEHNNQKNIIMMPTEKFK